LATDHEATWDNGVPPKREDPKKRAVGIERHPIREVTSAAFRSIIYVGQARETEGTERTAPSYFSDLNLDQVFRSVSTGYEEYDLAPYFYEHLDDTYTISYRQEVFLDLEREAVSKPVESFVRQMRDMREHLEQSNQLHYKYQKESWFVDATRAYYEAVVSLADALASVELGS
jgi:hypothetical protein